MSAGTLLQRLVHERQMQARLDAAALIRDYPPGPERTTVAEKYIRETLLDCAVGAISDDEQKQVLHILDFAVSSFRFETSR